MAKKPDINVEEVFVPDTDLSKYEQMDTLDIYKEVMQGGFNLSGLPNSTRVVGRTPSMGSTLEKRHYITSELHFKLSDGRDSLIKASVLDQYYFSGGQPLGPQSLITLRAMRDAELIQMQVEAIQKSTELFLGAVATLLDPLTGKPLNKNSTTTVVRDLHVGNNGVSDSNVGITKYHERGAKPAEKRAIGVAIECMGRAAAKAK